MTDNSNDRPRFPTCDDSVGTNHHRLDAAFGATWCECDHTCILNYINNRGGAELEHEEVPTWWRDALTAAHTENPRGVDDLEEAWAALCALCDSIAYNGDTWDRWDEFDRYWGTEERLKLLEAAGIATVGVASWDYQDGQNVWHDGNKCGCTQVDFELLAEKAVA